MNWTEFKAIVQDLGLKIQLEKDTTSKYKLRAFNGPRGLSTTIKKTSPAGTDQTDFETNFLSSVDEAISQPITIGSVTSGAGIPCFSKNYRLDTSFTKIDLPTSSSSYLDIYSYSGTGLLNGFVMDFNSDRVLVRLEVDSQQVFEIDCDDLESYVDDTGKGGGGEFGCALKWNKSKDQISFWSSNPICFTTSVKIQAKANSDSSSRDMNAYAVEVQKDG